MNRMQCPYLGLKDDPTTAMGFPSPGNYCHQGRPIAPVKGPYQEKYCLTSDHTACPVYQASHPVPLPPAIAASSIPILNGRQVLVLLGIPAMVVAAAALVYAWNVFGARIPLFRNIPNTGPATNSSNFQLLNGQAAATYTPLSPFGQGTDVQTPTINCPLPSNWVPYTVNPTDSLFRLSVIYGVTVDQLQKANCMGNKTIILPGQTIYVPFIPTNTPISTDTLAPQVILPTNTRAAPLPQAPTDTPVPPGVPTNTPNPPTNTIAPTGTPVPPTNTIAPTSTPVPPTDTVAPSATPIPPTNTSQPSKTPRPRRTRQPTATNPPPPPATATNPPPAPTATNPPQPTSPPPTAPPPPPATATNLPVATNPLPPLVASATSPPPPPSPPPPATATSPPAPTNPPPPPATATNPPVATSPPLATSAATVVAPASTP